MKISLKLRRANVLNQYLGAIGSIVLLHMLLMGCGILEQAPSLSNSPTPVTTSVATQSINNSTTPAAQPGPTSNATAQSGNTLAPDVVAVVNGYTISQDDYERQVAQVRAMYIDQAGLDPNSEAAAQILAQLRQQVRERMIDQVLLQRVALASNIQITDAQLNDHITQIMGQDSAKFEQWLQENGLTVESLRQQLANDLLAAAVRDAVTADLPKQQVHIRARYIFTTDQGKALEALARLQAGADFGAIAREYSMDETTRASGGDLGIIPHGVMPLAFDQAAFTLESNQISEVVSMVSGFMIIQVLEIDPTRTVSDENWPLVQQYAFETWLANERAQAEITFNPAFD